MIFLQHLFIPLPFLYVTADLRSKLPKTLLPQLRGGRDLSLLSQLSVSSPSLLLGPAFIIIYQHAGNTSVILQMAHLAHESTFLSVFDLRIANMFLA